MNSQTAEKLITLNKEFYREFAQQFSVTRQRLQPGVVSLLQRIAPSAYVLDLGCGNGAFARALSLQGHFGGYVGLDFSADLLNEAKNECPVEFSASFFHIDLTFPTWQLPISPGSIDIAVAFAVLHHIPSKKLRKQTLIQICQLLKPESKIYISNWQFLQSPKMRQRIQIWKLINLTPDQVDDGDYLLDWRRGGYGLRYVHHFSETELDQLAIDTGFSVLDTFYSDGETKNLGIYQIWQKN